MAVAPVPRCVVKAKFHYTDPHGPNGVSPQKSRCGSGRVRVRVVEFSYYTVSDSGVAYSTRRDCDVSCLGGGGVSLAVATVGMRGIPPADRSGGVDLLAAPATVPAACCG